MVLQIKIGAVRETAELVKLVWIVEMKIHRAFGIMGALPILDLNFFDILRFEAQTLEPHMELRAPVFKLLFPGFFRELCDRKRAAEKRSKPILSPSVHI